MTIVDSMRESRKSPKVLKLKVIKIKGEHPDVLILIHEGVEDVPVYEAWLSRLLDAPQYEPIAGAGKEQLLAFRAELDANNDPLKDSILFFIDRDFDLPHPEHQAVYELPAYSIENFLCSEEVLDSLLRDEFRCAGDIAQRKSVISKFQEIQENFRKIAEPVNFILFAARRSGVDVLCKPSCVDEIATINLCSVTANFSSASEIVKLKAEIPEDRQKSLAEEFSQLPPELSNRGKYELEMFRRWLQALMADRRCSLPDVFLESKKIGGDPGNLPMRRFASASIVPAGLREFFSVASRRNTLHRDPKVAARMPQLQ